MSKLLTELLPSKAAHQAAPALAQGIISVALKLEHLETTIKVDPTTAFDVYYNFMSKRIRRALLTLALQNWHTTTVLEVATTAPFLVIDRVLKLLAPTGYKLDRIQFQYPDIYGNMSQVLEKTPRSTIQSLFVLMAYLNYAPYVAGATVRGVSLHTSFLSVTGKTNLHFSGPRIRPMVYLFCLR